MADYILVNTEDEYFHAARLFKDYAVWLNIDLSFQHFEEELQELKVMYGAPAGGIILCKINDAYIGCVAIRKLSGDTAELKRMFVEPAFRGMGIGKGLLVKAIELARTANYCCIRLDTLNYMLPAINLYKRNGFYEIPPYYNNPNSTAVYFEMKC